MGESRTTKKIFSDSYNNYFQKYQENVEKMEEEVEVEDKVVR